MMQRSAPFLLVILLVTFLVSGTISVANSSLFDRQQGDELLKYAKELLLASVGNGAPPSTPSAARSTQRGCFVTFFVGRRVIACFGSFHPRTANLGEEIAENVAGALRNDPRAGRIGRDEVLKAGVQITFPGQLQEIDDYRLVDPAREGLFAEYGEKGVAIVPGEAKTASWAYREARRRLGMPPVEDIRLHKFQAEFISTRR
jgi:AMMECR1 domain-containing protein